MSKFRPSFMHIQYNAPFSLTFALLSLVALGLAKLTGGVSTVRLFSVYPASLSDPLTYVRLFGHVLGHSGIQHYAGNFLIILMVGPLLEEKYGSSLLAIMAAITAAVTGILFMILTSKAALLGASGVVFMMILLSSFANIQQGRIPLTLVVVIIIYLGQEFVAGMTRVDSISHLAHIIGGLCGVGFGFFLSPKMRKK